MKQYGDFTDLPATVEQYIKNIINELKRVDNESISIYYGYPIIELDGQETIMKACIVSKKAVSAFYAENAEMQVYERHLVKIFLESPDLSELYFSRKNDMLHCLNIYDDFDINDFILKEDIFTDEQYKKINSIIQKIYGLNTMDTRKVSHKSSLGEMIKKRNNEINMLNEK